MFGNAPKALWTRWIEPDAQNRIPLACRAMLIEEPGGRRVLCETGIGAFFPPDLRERYGVVEAEHVLLRSLEELGLSHEMIDVVVLSHLHFDHAGGLLRPYAEGAEPELLFPNARFVVGQRAWERAADPHPRDRRSFIPELLPLLEGSGRLELVQDGATSPTLGSDYRFHLSEGHTPGLLLLEVATPRGPVVFGGDLVPGVPWVHVPITMGYDRFPEQLIDEKAALLADLLARDGWLFFTHDAGVALGQIARDDHGKFFVQNTLAAPRRWPNAVQN
ncbi:MAG: MBL fold metallo-hydrolase [Planctomycetes bacterium]|nr:MBL fold metallo-hydrolase [Planctomycetota bacterium]